MPLEHWPTENIAALPKGLSRHTVRFAHLNDHVIAIKETLPELARREYDMLKKLQSLDVPCVEPFAIINNRTTAEGEELLSVLITRHLKFSLPYRAMWSQGLRPETATRLVDALAVLLVRLHIAGFFWGDVSLSNTLFRRDAGAFAAYLVDAETGQLYEGGLSNGQRENDLEIARVNIAGELMDLIASGIQPVLIEHPRSKELIEAVPTAETEALLITKGLLRQSQKAESVERQIDQLKASMERNVFRRSREAMWTELVKAVHASAAPVTPSADLVRAWLVNQCDHMEYDDLAAMFNLPDTGDSDNAEQARLAAQRIPSVELWKAVVILMMAEDQAPTYLMTKTDSDLKKEPPHFTAVAQMLGMDLRPIELEARATVKAEINEEIKTLKAQIAPKPKAAPATTPAAGVDVSTGGKGAKAKKLEAPLRKPKTSASEAQAQIAAAMQAEEKTDPGADAQGIEATASGFALAVGARMWTPWACAPSAPGCSKT